MTTFHDALSGQKREFHFKTRATPAPNATTPWCTNSKRVNDHDFNDMDDEQSQCIRCGKTLLFARTLENTRKK